MASRALSNRNVATGWAVSGEHNNAAPPSGDFNTSFSEATRVNRFRRGTLPPPHKELTHQQARTWRRLQALAIPTPRCYHKIYPHLFDGTCTRCTGPEDTPQPGSLEHMFWERPNFAPPEMLKSIIVENTTTMIPHWTSLLQTEDKQIQLLLIERAEELFEHIKEQLQHRRFLNDPPSSPFPPGQV
ncbi:hypothetical protein ISCGN_013652 [Ixodes scapularis]